MMSKFYILFVFIKFIQKLEFIFIFLIVRLIVRINRFKWFNTAINNNQMQCQAVKNIVNETSYPAPYLLFGPPGN